MDEKELKIAEIEKKIESNNIFMKSMKFDRCTAQEKIDYIMNQIKLFRELKELVGFIDKWKINRVLNALEISLGNVSSTHAHASKDASGNIK